MATDEQIAEWKNARTHQAVYAAFDDVLEALEAEREQALVAQDQHQETMLALGAIWSNYTSDLLEARRWAAWFAAERDHLARKLLTLRKESVQ